MLGAVHRLGVWAPENQKPKLVSGALCRPRLGIRNILASLSAHEQAVLLHAVLPLTWISPAIHISFLSRQRTRSTSSRTGWLTRSTFLLAPPRSLSHNPIFPPGCCWSVPHPSVRLHPTGTMPRQAEQPLRPTTTWNPCSDSSCPSRALPYSSQPQQRSSARHRR